jgi:hypothetical protein
VDPGSLVLTSQTLGPPSAVAGVPHGPDDGPVQLVKFVSCTVWPVDLTRFENSARRIA